MCKGCIESARDKDREEKGFSEERLPSAFLKSQGTLITSELSQLFSSSFSRRVGLDKGVSCDSPGSA